MRPTAPSSPRLTARGHRVSAGGELSALAEAKVVRRTDRGSLVTDGPYAESAEQAGGFYLVESDDLDDLLAVVGLLTRAEPVVEVRPSTVTPAAFLDRLRARPAQGVSVPPPPVRQARSSRSGNASRRSGQ